MLKELPELIAKSQTINYIGKIENVTGMAMEASANNSRIGDLVLIYNEKQKREIPAEVVGFHGDKVSSWHMRTSAASVPAALCNTGKHLKVPVGEFLRGRIIDALGHPLDNKGEIGADKYYYVENETVNPLLAICFKKTRIYFVWYFWKPSSSNLLITSNGHNGER